MEMLSTLLALCEGNPHLTSEFPSQNASTVELDFSLMIAWTSFWTNSQISGDLIWHEAHETLV